MTINLELTPQIKKWLDTEPSDRSFDEGAMLLLKVTRNRILFNNIMRSPQKHARSLEYHLNKIYVQRLADITHEQVKSLMKEVGAIAKARNLDAAAPSEKKSVWQAGKRADHDELPAQIQQLYVDNADIMRRMRDTHTKIRLISPENSTCPDSDRFPLAKYLIELDRRYRDNWNRYDHYIKGSDISDISLASVPRSDAKNAAKLCNLLLGKYDKSPDEALAARIKETYAKIEMPHEHLREKMKKAGLL